MDRLSNTPPKDQLAAWLQVLASITSSLDLDHVLAVSCRAAVEILGVTHCGLVLFDADLRAGTVRAEFPEAFGARGIRIPIQGIPAEEHLVSSGRALVIPHVEQAIDLGPVRDLLIGLGIESILIVPIATRDHILGSFSLDVIGQVHDFTEGEIELSQALAAQVAIAIDNATLLGDARRRASQLEALRKATLAVTAQRDKHQLMSSLLEAAVVLLKAKSGGVYEYDRHRDELRITADSAHPELIGTTLRGAEGMAGRLIKSGEPYLVS